MEAPECQICMESYAKGRMPTTLGCGHSICMICAKQMLKAGKIICPFDKQQLGIGVLKPNYEMLNIIEESSARVANAIKEIENKHKQELQNKITEAVTISGSKADRKMKKKIREAEAKMKKNMEREMKIKYDEDDKGRSELMQDLLRQNEMNLEKTEKEKKAFMENLKKQQEEERKKEREIQAEIMKKILLENEKKYLEDLEKERKYREDLEKEKKNRETLEKEKKLKEDLEQEQKRLKDLEKEAILKQQIIKAEEEKAKKQIQTTIELERAELKRQMEYEKNKLKEEMLLEHEKIKQKMQEEALEAKKRLEIEKETQIKEYTRLEEIKRQAEEQMEKSSAKINQKLKYGRIAPHSSENNSKKRCNDRDSNQLYWAFQAGRNNYMPYYDNISTMIESAFYQGKKQFYIRNKGTVDFVKWCEMRDNGEIVQIKRVNALVGKATWKYWNDSCWEDFDEANTYEIERAWLTGQPNLMITTGGYFDLDTLKVMVKGKERPVIRIVER